MPDHAKALASIATCEDPAALRSWIRNARTVGAIEVEKAALRRLFSVIPGEQPGTVEYEFWSMVTAFEYALLEERGRTTRLARTRQKVARDGVVATLRQWALQKTASRGFDMLLALGMPEYTGEAIILRHRDNFDADTVAAARRRLEDAGIVPADVA